MKKEVLLDSSSAILLEKCGLLDTLLASYRVIVSEAVFLELTENGYPSATLFQSRILDAEMKVRRLVKDPMLKDSELDALSSMGRGEQETILHFLSGTADFIMLDDGKGARFCHRHHLPFINALLFPKILNLSGRISRKQRDLKSERIRQVGRYSQKILEKVDALSTGELAAFFP